MSTAQALVRQPGEGRANAAFALPRRIIMSADDTGGRLTLIEETVPPGAGPPLHIHHDAEELFRLLEGQVRFVAGERDLVLDPGCDILVPRGLAHTFKNVGSSTARMMITLTPGGLDRFFVEVEDQGLTPPGDMARIVEIASRHGLEFVGPPL